MNVVYVLSPERRPLMPCASVVARLLLKEGKAKVVRRTPFTIKLVSQPESTYTQALTLGVDTGSSVIGSAVAEENGKVLYLSEVEIRCCWDVFHSMGSGVSGRPWQMIPTPRPPNGRYRGSITP